MAELNQHDEIVGGVDRGAFYAVMSAMASRDPKRVARADGDALLIVSVNRLIYIKSLNDFRDFFYS